MDDEPEEKTRCQVCLTGCKHVTTFILSHVGLLTLVVGYCLVGAVTFEALEVGHELEVKSQMTEVRQSVSKDLWAMTRSTELIHPERWTENATKRLQEFEKELLNAIKKSGWDGSEDPEQLNWTFTGSLFYSIIVITTIGYGHIAPKTLWGKIVTIFYAIVGIPLMVICWSHIGDFMANSFRVIYWKVCCYICTRRPKHRQRGHLRRGRSVRGPPPRGSVKAKRSIRRSARTSQRSADSAISDSVVSTISDPGVGFSGGQRGSVYAPAVVPKTTQPKSIHSHTHATGPRPSVNSRTSRSAEPDMRSNLPILYNKYAEDLVNISTIREVEHDAEEPKPRHSTRMSRNRSVPPEIVKHRQEEAVVDYWDEDFDEYAESEYEEEDHSNRPVPIWLCSSLVISYIIGGAFLFSSWESWNFLDSAYFCFITLTTIGFGDFVPTQESEVSIALCSLYLLFGIALLAMSFNLVQEQVINSVKELAMTLGIIDEEEQ